MKNNSAKVGLFIVIGLLIFISAIVLIGSMRKLFVPSIQASAIFADVSGLSKGNNVTFSGVKVGTVSSLEFIPNSGVKVFFNITKKSQKFIYKDAEIKVSTDGLIGNPILVVSGGKQLAGIIPDGHAFKVSLEESQQDVIKTLQKSNNNILAITEDVKFLIKDLRNGKGDLGKLIKEEQLYSTLAQTLNKLNNSATEVGQITSNFNNLSNSLNNKDALPYQLTHNTSIMPQLNETTSNLKESSITFKQTAAETNVLIKDLNKNINNLLTDKNSPLGVITKDDKAAENIKNTLINLESSSRGLNENMEALKHNIFFRRYFKKKEEKAESDIKEK